MNLSTRKNHFDASSFEKLGQKIKVTMYSLLHELIQSNVTNKLLYKFFLLIETAQFLWFMLHPRFEFLWTTEVADALRQPLKYLQFAYFIDQGNEIILMACLYTVLGIEIFIAILIYFIVRSMNSTTKKNSTLLTYAIKTVSLFSILITTIFTIPFFNAFIAILYCNESDHIHTGMKCYSGIYIVHFVAAIFGTLLLLGYLVMFLPFYIDLNPWSTLPTASPQSIVPFGKLIMKIFGPGFFTIDWKGSLDIQFAALSGIYWVIVLFFRYQALPYFDRSINRFILICESILLWSGGVLNIHAFLDSNGVDNIGLLFLIVAAPFITTTYVSFVEKRYAEYIKADSKMFKKDSDMEMYVNVLIDLIKNKHDPVKRIQLEGVLKYYVMRNSKADNKSVSIKLLQANLKEDTPEKDLLWYQWLRDILEEGLFEKFKKSTRLHLLHSYLQQEKLSNKFKALYELLLTDENKPEIQEEFAIFRYKNIIEVEIIENDNNSSENKGIDVNILVDFQNKFVEFQSLIEKSVSYHLDFWRELLEDNPDIQKLQNLSSKITNSVEQVAENFNKISEINNNHTKMLRIYGNFLRDIVNDDAEGRKLLEKADYIEKTSSANKQFIDNERLKYGENSNTCIITCSGNYNTLGTVTNINNEITRILGFVKADIMGQNINRLMPKIMADSHDSYMRRYFETSEPFVMGSERMVFPINKAGYLVPCSLMTKVLPSLDEGIRVVGFLKDLENESSSERVQASEVDENVHYIMYNGDTYTVYGISNSCLHSFGIPSNLVYGNASSNELVLDNILPKIKELPIEDIKNPNGFVTTLDSTVLQQNYHLGDNGSESGDEDNEQQDAQATAKYKIATIRAVLIQDEQYKDVTKQAFNQIRVLKFVETVEGEDNFTTIKKILPDAKEKLGEEAIKLTQEIQNDNLGASEEKSSISQGEEGHLNDKMKQLKDAKTLISEKNVPKSIRFLKRVGISVFIGWLVVACVNLAITFQLKDEIDEGAYATLKAYERYDVMANINYQLRKLELLSRTINTTNSSGINPAITASENTLKQKLVDLINQMQGLQFEVIKADIKMQKRASDTFPEQTVTIESLLSKKVKYDQSNLTDALFTYLSQASSVRNASLSSFGKDSDVETTKKNFFFVRRNGLGSLRNGSEASAERFYDFYSNQTSYYRTVFLILAIVGIIVGVIFNGASLPIISSLHHTNKKVLSMFGYIPTDEINSLAVKCEKFIKDHLEDRTERRDYSFESEEASQSMNKKDKEEDVSHEKEEALLIEKGDQEDNTNGAIDNAPKSPGNKKKSNNDSYLPPDIKKNAAGVNINDVKLDNNEDFEGAIEKAEYIRINRSQKLMNSRKNQNKSDILRFLFAIATYVAVSLTYFFLQKGQIEDSQILFEHLKLIAQGIPQIRYVNVYTLEELAENDLNQVYQYLIGSITTNFNARQSFLTAVQNNERDIAISEKRSFPGSFDDYKARFRTLYFGDLCKNYYYNGSNATLAALNSCTNVLDGLLEQGLKVGVKTIVSNSIDTMNEFYASARTTVEQNQFINSSKFVSSENILEQVAPALTSLLIDYKAAFDTFTQSLLTLAEIWFSVTVVALFLAGIFLWIPYMKRIRNDIWRTKGMLNMIPMELISKNENLRELFIKGELTKAVQ